MSDGTSLGDKNTIDRTQVFAVYNVYRLVIGSVLFALTLADTASGLLSDYSALQKRADRQLISVVGMRSSFGSENEIVSG